MTEYLTQRPQAAVSSYDQSHPVTLPFIAELDPLAANATASLSGAAVAVAPSGGNLPEGPAPIDVDMTANADTAPSSEAQQPSPQITLAPLTLEADGAPGMTDGSAEMAPPDK
jgi:hypothetical protein